jgi:hypothetical protein
VLLNAVNSMTGRANIEIYQIKVSYWRRVFFSARNLVADCKSSKPLLPLFAFYRYGFQTKQTSVANKLAVTNMFRFAL